MKTFSFLLLLFLLSCAKDTDSKYSKVKVGLTTAQLIEILGEPSGGSSGWILPFDSAGLKLTKTFEVYHYSKDTAIFIDLSTDTVSFIETNYSKNKDRISYDLKF